jgi:hypothetical protein
MPLRREIDESIISGRKTGAEMGLLYNVSDDRVTDRGRPPASVWLSVQF